ncbi:MAG: HD domain-containing protein [Defluviitaleaceae bacterium]|nr:HD domain-containing protein [Defluviitaleaceae bacterium]
MRYIEDLKEDDKIMEHYLCKEKKKMQSKAGKNYLNLTLMDKTGTINGKIWELNNDIGNFEEGDYIKIDGTVILFNNDRQMKITRVRKSREDEYQKSDYIPTTEKDVEVLFMQILTFIEETKNPYIKKLLENIFVHNKVVNSKIKTHSAAKKVHHAYLGGLIEHIVSVTEICLFFLPRYKFINRDLLVAGALLHDIGKIIELSPMPESLYTDEGQLLGHILIGIDLVSEEASRIENFPHDTLVLLKHLIASHHGELEYGSPQTPRTIEAIVLHLADNTDSRIKIFEEALQKSNEADLWIGFNVALGRDLRKTWLSEYE